jgi:DNA repair protein RAD51
VIVSTGSRSLDSLLAGGIRSGLVTDFYGKSGTGKSQLCFTACVNCARKISPGETIMFIDTTGNFRPERIKEIASYKRSSNILNKIYYVRVFNSSDQFNAVKRVHELKTKMIIVDNISSLFSNELKGFPMHLSLMKYMHTLCLTAINFDCAVIITNMLRYVQGNNFFTEREFMTSSISLYAHIRAKLEIVNQDKLEYKATLLQPSTSKSSYFSIEPRGITDIYR